MPDAPTALHEAISHAVGEMLGYGDEPEIANVVLEVLGRSEHHPAILNIIGDVHRGWFYDYLNEITTAGVHFSPIGEDQGDTPCFVVVPRKEAPKGEADA